MLQCYKKSIEEEYKLNPFDIVKNAKEILECEKYTGWKD